MKRWLGGERPQDTMGREEAAIWLGRAISTHDVTIRVLLQMMDVLSVQQQVLQGLFETNEAGDNGPQPSEALEEMSRGLSEELLNNISELRAQVAPILEMVEESCQTLEKMMGSR